MSDEPIRDEAFDQDLDSTAPDFSDPNALWSVLNNATKACPFCGEADWVSEGVIDAQVRPKAGARVVEVPCLFVVCRVCGFTRFHAVAMIRRLHEAGV